MIYTDQHHEWILAHYRRTAVKELAENFNGYFGTDISAMAMKSYLNNRKLCTGAPKGHKPKYTKEILEFIREHGATHTEQEIAELINEKWNLGIDGPSVSNAKYRYGYQSGIQKNTFRKGHEPANKGKKQIDYMSEEKIERTKATRFKKGQFSPNRVPIGTERLSKDGYVEVKIQDGTFQHNWKGKHRIIWEAANGPIPDKYRIIFLDGDKSNIKLENLRCVSYGATAVMNKKNLFTNVPELTETNSLIAEVIVKMGKRKKKKEDKILSNPEIK